MFKNLLGFLFLTLALTTGTLAQESDQENTRELHFFAAHQGSIRTGDRIHGPEVTIDVNRPGKSVILALSPQRPIRFHLNVDAATTLADVYFIGPRAEKSEVYVNGAQHTATLLADVPFVSADIGVTFRQALARLSQVADVDRAASVQVLTRPPEGPAAINAASELTRMRAVYLPDLVQPDRLNDHFRTVIDGRTPTPSLELTNEGFALTENGSVSHFPLTLDVPPISHPVAAAYDAEGQALYGVTLGGEGFIYRYDIGAEQWSVVASMNQEDATGMVYDPVGKRLILAVLGRHNLDGTVLREWSRDTGLRHLTLGIKVGDMPGLTDLYEGANGPRPALVPLAIHDSELLVRTVPARYARHSNAPAPMSRTYILDLGTSQVALVAYVGD